MLAARGRRALEGEELPAEDAERGEGWLRARWRAQAGGIVLRSALASALLTAAALLLRAAVR